MPPRAKRVQTIDTYKRFESGAKSSIGVAAVQMVATSLKVKQGVLIKADINNAGTVYVGNSASVTAGAVDSTSGFPLEPNDWLELEVDDVSSVYLIASQANQKVYWITV